VRAASESPDLPISFQVYSAAGVSDAWLFSSVCLQDSVLEGAYPLRGLQEEGQEGAARRRR
jgi:hypothetical protein